MLLSTPPVILPSEPMTGTEASEKASVPGKFLGEYRPFMSDDGIGS
jgi:hypothetical protein